MDAEIQIPRKVRRIRVVPGNLAATTPVDPGMMADVLARLPVSGLAYPLAKECLMKCGTWALFDFQRG